MISNLNWQVIFWSQYPYYLTLIYIRRWFIHLRQLTNDSKFYQQIKFWYGHPYWQQWQIIPNFNWQTMFWLQCPYWQLNDNSKFYQTGHVLISTSILAKLMCLEMNYLTPNLYDMYKTIYPSETNYLMLIRRFIHLRQLTNDSKFKLTNHVLIWAFLLTTVTDDSKF